MRQPNPIDLITRAVALPGIVWSAAGVMRAIVGSATDVLNDAAENFLGQVEDTCRSRWTQMFDGSPDLPETESTAA